MKRTAESVDLRDVAMKIEQAARSHPAWSMVHDIVYAATKHIQALAGNIENRSERMIDIYKLHEQMTKPLFPKYSSEDERFLALALAGEVGELCNMVKKRWRDSADYSEEIKDELADIRVYTELLAKCFGIEGDKLDERVQSKLQKVAEKWKHRLDAEQLKETVVNKLHEVEP